ncbi:hypothetical protein [Caballeronia ptereochthonis]|uniref:Uncharacterized protein n=1 Tax=Caballeronia ptereochthonis TaxID=1777144 RepID=A0A158A361_9BURK|nr:hypothetical protein [Caballeronia ptereochthonis]SAK52262.1 hypothetical protein AWB83_01253 [Caballeronia ptereochthonis]
MQKDIEVGDYLLAMQAVPRPREAEGDADADAAPSEGYAIRVRVTRLDQKPVHGAKLADDSGEMTGDHGLFDTVAEAIAHGEAWGRHYIARVLGHAV